MPLAHSTKSAKMIKNLSKNFHQTLKKQEKKMQYSTNKTFTKTIVTIKLNLQ